jgi:FkbM family methyltransferase
MHDVNTDAFERYPIRKAAWRLAWPIRKYVQHMPFARGKGILLRGVLIPILPGGAASFSFALFEGPRITLRYRETLGRALLLNDGFEESERQALRSLTNPGSTAIDVGANIGIFSLSLAEAVGPEGAVWAFEPVSDTASRLRANLDQNGLKNTVVIVAAAGNSEGDALVQRAKDSAYSITVKPNGKAKADESLEEVPKVRLDTIWNQMNRPQISVAKIDVEGAELEVLQGALELLEACHPTLLIEAPSESRLGEIATFLSSFGYRYSRPDGFMPWNYLFVGS